MNPLHKSTSFAILFSIIGWYEHEPGGRIQHIIYLS